MPAIRLNKFQVAQGMVEFALVLPILLLLILGVFAFGHLFFAYSSVVSASREAARWGSAVGTAGALQTRFQNCDAIRATAVRVGAFAGVSANESPNENTPGTNISFDHGPNDPDLPYDDCSDGVGPDDVAYGDRINVRVTVLYHPIVPLINFPEFPLNATTSRTIVKSLPVGEAPTSLPFCPSTSIIAEFLPWPIPATLPADPVVGQAATVRVRVTASDGTSPTGKVYIQEVDVDGNIITDGHSCEVEASSATPGQMCGSVDGTGILVPARDYQTVGVRYFTLTYDNEGACFRNSIDKAHKLTVIKANTLTVITRVDPLISLKLDPNGIRVWVTVSAASPGVGTPTGNVYIRSTKGKQDMCGGPINLEMGDTCLIPGQKTTLDVYAEYQGDANFNASNSDTVTLEVAPDPTATPTPTPTPTVTPKPLVCPSLVGAADFSITDSLQFQISNAGGSDTVVNAVDLTWPDYPPAPLRDIRFGTLGSLGACDTNGQASSRNCLWKAANQNSYLGPTHQYLTTSTSGWDSVNPGPGTLLAEGSKYMRLFFNAVLPGGGTTTNYTVKVSFSNGCLLTVTATH